MIDKRWVVFGMRRGRLTHWGSVWLVVERRTIRHAGVAFGAREVGLAGGGGGVRHTAGREGLARWDASGTRRSYNGNPFRYGSGLRVDESIKGTWFRYLARMRRVGGKFGANSGMEFL